MLLWVDNLQALIIIIDISNQIQNDLTFKLNKYNLELCIENDTSNNGDTTNSNINVINNTVQSLKIHPNPYSHNTNITYSINNTSTVLLEIYNTLGEKITVLQNSTSNPRTYTQQFSGKQLGYSCGIYIVKLTIGENTYSQRLIELE